MLGFLYADLAVTAVSVRGVASDRVSLFVLRLFARFASKKQAVRSQHLRLLSSLNHIPELHFPSRDYQTDFGYRIFDGRLIFHLLSLQIFKELY